MTSFTIGSSPNQPQIVQPGDNCSPQCSLEWRQGQLLVKLARHVKQLYLPAVDDPEWLVECLKHSPVELVRIDPQLGEAKLLMWAEACKQAHKQIFLRIPPDDKPRPPETFLSRWVKPFMDWCLALILLLVATPVMMALVLLIRLFSPGPLFDREWFVGRRGKLFAILKFHARHNRILRIVRRYGGDKLLQLLNVLRGEMSLIGSRPQSLSEAVLLNPQAQRQLNTLPGMLQFWQAKEEESSLVLMQ
ncbi:MAG: heterocyst development glycosyltransferase HepC [Nostocaceae cyanobacterium]|nr:heterocyst development glycosyltransferase HepC [Nostocaceae cyanobacterium]